MTRRQTARSISARKGGERLVMLTAYDAPTTRLAEEAGADMLLVGDSLAMVVLGHPDTLSVTVEEMVHHCKAVCRTARHALVVGDLPFLSYEAGPAQALDAAGRLVKEGGVRAVKLEGGREVLPQVEALLMAGIPVMGHVGLTPQRLARLGGFRVQGRDAASAQAVLDDALALARAGCFAVVMECVPADLARIITAALPCPTIGIGAGAHCDGQVLVVHDVLGLHEGLRPSFVKRYAELGVAAREALGRYAAEVRQGAFPGPEHSFSMDSLVLEGLTIDGFPVGASINDVSGQTGSLSVTESDA
ncbi:3-methyl-2-oxobutanoate hydroxymethyltransferase [Megalodesulfovibrio paquesii]